ncbi:unnamed protein product [Linum tenue]|uniref:Uncharacterized protein n=1 Tax=Linum tenue TaxID=586396 RepID=A0AAV0HFD0_9ROSI|nr:unnamed protein product [Linum tenue]
MDHVVKSAFYKDYIEHVTAEATLHLLAEIIQQRKKEIGVILIEGKRPRSPIFDNEWDVLEADLEDVGRNIATIVGQTTELKCALLREIAELYPPSGPVKSVFWREPTRWGLKDIMGVILRGASSLER